MEPDALLETANSLFERGKITKALEAYQTFALNHPLHPQNALVQYRIAESYYQIEDYENAEFEYSELLRLYPDSPDIEEANFKLATCFCYRSLRPALDQEMTETALLKLRSFVADFPNSQYVPQAKELMKDMRNKLLEKKYLNANTYFDMRSYSAALMYLDEILAQPAPEALLAKSYLLKAECLIEKKEFSEAEQVLQKLQTEMPQFKPKRIEKLMRQAQAGS